MSIIKTCVVAVSYHGSADTAECVRSVAQSSVPTCIIVVDTTPNDPDLDAALALYPSVVLIRASGNIGFGQANNLGIEWAFAHTQCEFIFFLNNDAVVYPDSIEKLEIAMADQQKVGIMVPRIAYLADPSQLWYGGGEVDWRRASAFTPGMNQSSEAKLATTERDVTFATGCALFIRRSILQRIGGFDPRYFMYEEDVELCIRASKNGARIRYLPTSTVLHRVQGSSRTSDDDRTDFWSTKSPKLPFYAFHVIRNRLLTIYLHARGKNLLTAVCFFPLFIIRRALPFLRDNRLDAVIAMINGIVDSWRVRQALGRTATEHIKGGTTG